MNIKRLLHVCGFCAVSASSFADVDSWFTRPYFGLSQMSDTRSGFDNIDNLSGSAEIDLSGGFTSGLGIGYRYTTNLAFELGWEYRSNDSAVTLAEGSVFNDGNYASNLFYLNGHYIFNNEGAWEPYVGLGLTWLQEIDIDLERDGLEQSFSGDGDIGYQIFGGVNYKLSEHWKLQSELRYGSATNIELKGEADTVGEFSGIDYQTTTVQLGVVFSF